MCFYGCGNAAEKEIKVQDIYKPIWLDDTAYEETLVVVQEENGEKAGNLLYSPTEILKVCDYSLRKEYGEENYRIEGNKFILTDNSSIPYLTFSQYYRADVSELPGGSVQDGADVGKSILYTESDRLIRYHITMTYKHADEWQGKVSEYQGDRLPNTVSKLKNGSSFSLFVTGDSIAYGCWSSAMLNIPPYRLSFVSGFAEELENIYGVSVNLNNQSVGGWHSLNGKEKIDEQIQSCAPDLAIIAFGMNDGFYHVLNTTYESNVRYIINSLRQASPDCEIILIATILPNPEWGASGTQAKYLNVLNKIASDTVGCAVVDMTSTTQKMYERKRCIDVLGNNINHPSDYLQRVYVQQFMTAICKNYK